MKFLFLALGLAIFSISAIAEPANNISAIQIPGTSTYRLRVNFDESISFETYGEEVEHKTENWILLKNGESITNFDIAASRGTDIQGNLTNELLGYELVIRDFDRFAEYKIYPDETLRNKYEKVTPEPALLKEVTLWQPDKNPFAKTRPEQGFLRLFEGQYLTIDIQPTTDSDDDPAINIDYLLKIDHGFTYAEQSPDQVWQGFSMEFRSDGKRIILPKDDDEDELGSIKNILSLKGNWTFWKSEAKHFNILTSSSNDIEEARLKGVFDPADIYIDAHIAHETIQDFEDQQIAIGIGLTATYPFPRIINGIPLPLLPLTPILLPKRSELATVQQPWFVLSGDAVFVEESDRMKFSNDDEFERIMLEIGWTSEIFFPNMWLYGNFIGWWEIDPPAEVKKAGQDFENYWEVGLKLPILREKRGGTSPWIVVKYQDGALPPNFNDDTQVKAGFSFEF